MNRVSEQEKEILEAENAEETKDEAVESAEAVTEEAAVDTAEAETSGEDAGKEKKGIGKKKKTDEEKNISRIQITIHEGKNRQVRRMCEAIGKKVLSLHRSKIGNISVKDLKLGTWRYLRKSEIDNLLK